VNVGQDALGILEEFAHFKDDETGDARALAFHRAAATLASLPRPVRTLQDVGNLPSIGEHSKKVIAVSFLYSVFCYTLV